jgi:hypothetical protein
MSVGQFPLSGAYVPFECCEVKLVEYLFSPFSPSAISYVFAPKRWLISEETGVMLKSERFGDWFVRSGARGWRIEAVAKVGRRRSPVTCILNEGCQMVYGMKGKKVVEKGIFKKEWIRVEGWWNGGIRRIPAVIYTLLLATRDNRQVQDSSIL